MIKKFVLLILLTFSFISVNSFCISSEGVINVETCLNKAFDNNDYFSRMTRVEFNAMNNEKQCYEEYSLLLKEVEQLFLKRYDGKDYHDLQAKDREKYFHLIKALAAFNGKVAYFGPIHKALSFARESKKYCDKYMEFNDKDFDIHLILATLYFNLPGFPLSFGDRTKAEEHFAFCKDICKNSEKCINFVYENRYAEFFIEYGEMDNAKNLIKDAMAKKPKNCNEFFNREILINFYKNHLSSD